MNAAQVRTGSAIKDLFLEATQSRHVDFSMASSSSSSSSLFGKNKALSKSSTKKIEKSNKRDKKDDKTSTAATPTGAKLTLILFEEVDEAWEMEFLSNLSNELNNEQPTTNSLFGSSSSNNNGQSSGSSSGSGGSSGSSSGVSGDKSSGDQSSIDNGFFAAMKTLMRSAKCAIVLTANRVPNAFEKLKCKVIPVSPPPHKQVYPPCVCSLSLTHSLILCICENFPDYFHYSII